MTARKYDSRRFRARGTLALLVVALAFLSASDILISQAQETALDRYVNSKDPVYGWKLIHTGARRGLPGLRARADVADLAHRGRRRSTGVEALADDRQARRTSRRTAMLFIGGGSNDNPAPTTADARTHQLRPRSEHRLSPIWAWCRISRCRSPTRRIKRRSEDDLIAYTRVKHFSDEGRHLAGALAMVKSGVRAMDAMQEFLASEAGGRLTVDRFVVSGGSKRGWTTWLVARWTTASSRSCRWSSTPSTPR